MYRYIADVEFFWIKTKVDYVREGQLFCGRPITKVYRTVMKVDWSFMI